MTDTATEQPTPGQDPQVTQTEPAAPAAPAPAGDAPWSNQLSEVFADEATRGQVDSFIRSQVQPYTTKLEQQVADARQATQLYTALQSDPIDTYVALTEELLGPEVAQQWLGTVQGTLSGQEQAPPQADPNQPPPAQQPPAPGDPRVDEVYNWYQNQQAEKSYEQMLNEVKADPQYADVNIDLLHPFVAAAEGNVPAAIELYRNYEQQYNAANAPPADPPPEAPNVIGSDSAAQSEPPTVPKGQSLDEAIEEMVRESRPNPAPPVA